MQQFPWQHAVIIPKIAVTTANPPKNMPIPRRTFELDWLFSQEKSFLISPAKIKSRMAGIYSYMLVSGYRKSEL